MTKVIFDTNIYLYASLGYEPMVHLIDRHVDELSSILMPSIIKAELLSIPKVQKDHEFKEFISQFIGYSEDENHLIPLTDPIIEIAAEVRIAWKEKDGKNLPLPDAIIGATAVHQQATLYSNNDKDFSFFVKYYGLNYVNPMNKQDINVFLEQNHLSS